MSDESTAKDLELATPIEECSEEPGWEHDRPAESQEAEEEEWLAAMARNPAFADLAAPEEDIYTPEDGEPFP